jgi:hypothetical protein
MASPFVACGVEVISQQIDLSTSAQVWPTVSPFTPATDQDSRQNQGAGDRALESSSAARMGAVAVFSEGDVILRRTNTESADVFWMESDFRMRSEADILTASSHVNTKGLASTSVSFQFRSDRSFQYRVVTSGQPLPGLPGASTITLRAANGQPVVEMTWTASTGDSGESQGTLPPGVYQVQFSSSATADGTVAPTLVNPISGAVRASVALTLTPNDSNPPQRAAVRLRRGSGDAVLLEMTDLQGGTQYFIERSEELTPELWQIAANFTAAGTNAVWTENLNRNAQKVFYRLRY